MKLNFLAAVGILWVLLGACGSGALDSSAESAEEIVVDPSFRVLLFGPREYFGDPFPLDWECVSPEGVSNAGTFDARIGSGSLDFVEVPELGSCEMSFQQLPNSLMVRNQSELSHQDDPVERSSLRTISLIEAGPLVPMTVSRANSEIGSDSALSIVIDCFDGNPVAYTLAPGESIEHEAIGGTTCGIEWDHPTNRFTVPGWRVAPDRENVLTPLDEWWLDSPVRPGLSVDELEQLLPHNWPEIPEEWRERIWEDRNDQGGQPSSNRGACQSALTEPDIDSEASIRGFYSRTLTAWIIDVNQYADEAEASGYMSGLRDVMSECGEFRFVNEFVDQGDALLETFDSHLGNDSLKYTVNTDIDSWQVLVARHSDLVFTFTYFGADELAFSDRDFYPVVEEIHARLGELG